MESSNNYQELLPSLPISSITIWSSHVLNSSKWISFNDSHQTFPSSLSTTCNDTTWYVILTHYISNINPIVFLEITHSKHWYKALLSIVQILLWSNNLCQKCITLDLFTHQSSYDKKIYYSLIQGLYNSFHMLGNFSPSYEG
jgi:hypothetical protein